MTIRNGGDQFLRWCRLNNYAPDTLNFYEQSLHNFSLFCSLEEPIERLNADTMEEYTFFLQKKDISSVTVHCYLRGMKTVIRYLADKGFISHFEIILPKTVTPVKEVYTEEELKKLLKKPDVKKCSFAEYRNWVIVNYLLGTGQRRNTVINLKIGDIDLPNKLVTLRMTKNKKQTILPLTKTLVAVLEEYLTYRGGDKEDYLFCTWEGKPITPDGLSNNIRKFNLRRGVDRTAMHLFRHTFAYLAMKNKMDILKLQRLLCHSRLDTTQKYLRSFGFEELKEDYEQYNPLERFMSESEVMHNWKAMRE
ncbi:MAG: site-specific integrase [Firmicutes bacterium]|nr:site-specific integrase [Bacillota bacterium]